MSDPYAKHLPPPDVAVELPPEELALFVLRFLNDPETSSYRNRYSFTLLSSTPYPGTERKQREAVAMALAEAWAWLEREGLVVLRPGSQNEWYEVSRRGKALQAQADFEAYRRGGLLRRDSLDPTLEQKVWPLFIRGDYDVVVFQAFKLIEVKVRRLADYPDSDYGVEMMRRAFAASGGPLADPKQEKGEREAVAALFWGAIGVFKNPGSHRVVAWHPAEAAEAVYLANTLLRMLGQIEERMHK